MTIRGLAGRGFNCDFSLEDLPLPGGSLASAEEPEYDGGVGDAWGVRRKCTGLGDGIPGSNRFCVLLGVRPCVRPRFIRLYKESNNTTFPWFLSRPNKL